MWLVGIQLGISGNSQTILQRFLDDIIDASYKESKRMKLFNDSQQHYVLV